MRCWEIDNNYLDYGPWPEPFSPSLHQTAFDMARGALETLVRWDGERMLELKDNLRPYLGGAVV